VYNGKKAYPLAYLSFQSFENLDIRSILKALRGSLAGQYHAGLPDFPRYKIPKRGKNIQNDHKI
jgi:hypothetical protein